MIGRIEPAIFREYDIRGVVDRDLSPDVVEAIARGLGRRLLRGGKTTAVVGRDVRLTSEAFAAAAHRGLQAVGLNTIDLGVVPTPAFYFALEKVPADALAGGIMVTGSHNPPQYNGLKIAEAKRTLFGADIQEIRRLAEEEALRPTRAVRAGTETARDILPEYIAEISSGITIARRIPVVLDCGNGTAGLAAPEIFRELGCETTVLFGEPDGRFPNHHPDPTVPANLAALIQTVKEKRAAIGIAFDGDADRIGAVDDEGGIIFGDFLLLLYAIGILKKGPATILSRREVLAASSPTRCARTAASPSCGRRATRSSRQDEGAGRAARGRDERAHLLRRSLLSATTTRSTRRLASPRSWRARRRRWPRGCAAFRIRRRRPRFACIFPKR